MYNIFIVVYNLLIGKEDLMRIQMDSLESTHRKVLIWQMQLMKRYKVGQRN